MLKQRYAELYKKKVENQKKRIFSVFVVYINVEILWAITHNVIASTSVGGEEGKSQTQNFKIWRLSEKMPKQILDTKVMKAAKAE